MKAKNVAPSLSYRVAIRRNCFSLFEEPLDQIAFAIEPLAEWIVDFAVGFIGNIRRCALRLDLRADPIGIITLVSKHDGSAFEVLQQVGRACRVVVLPGVIRRRSGRPFSSTSAWIFVVSPPRLRPTQRSPPPFLGNYIRN